MTAGYVANKQKTGNQPILIFLLVENRHSHSFAVARFKESNTKDSHLRFVNKLI